MPSTPTSLQEIKLQTSSIVQVNNNNNNELHENLDLLSLRPALYTLTQKAVILNICCTVRNFLAEQRIRSAWPVRPALFWEAPKRQGSKECG